MRKTEINANINNEIIYKLQKLSLLIHQFHRTGSQSYFALIVVLSSSLFCVLNSSTMTSIANIFLIVVVVSILHETFSLRELSRLRYHDKSQHLRYKFDLSALSKEDSSKPIIIEIITKSKFEQQKETTETTFTAYDTVYKEQKEGIVERVIQSPVAGIVQVLFNPTTMLLALYLSSAGWSKMTWLQKFLKLFGKGTLATKPGETKAAEPTFQIFECEVFFSILLYCTLSSIFLDIYRLVDRYAN